MDILPSLASLLFIITLNIQEWGGRGGGVGERLLRPPLTQNFISMGNSGYIWEIWITVFTLNIHTPYALPYTSIQQVHFTTRKCVQDCWMNGKQCKPWSDAAFCTIWSGSALFA